MFSTLKYFFLIHHVGLIYRYYSLTFKYIYRYNLHALFKVMR
jgi:hypothetical protein